MYNHTHNYNVINYLKKKFCKNFIFSGEFLDFTNLRRNKIQFKHDKSYEFQVSSIYIYDLYEN